MKKILGLLALLLVPQIVIAQSPPFVVAYPAGTPIQSGTPGVPISGAADKYGNIMTTTSSTSVIVPGTGATNLGKAAGNASGSTDTGVAALAYRENSLSSTGVPGTNGQYGRLKIDDTGSLWIREAQQSSVTATNPTIATATSSTCIGANAFRRWFYIQNNTAANIMISISGQTLTGIVPTATNQGIVLVPGQYYTSAPNLVPVGAITCYQTSGGNTNLISVGDA